MGRGSKIFILSALIAGCVFGLISFVILSAIADSTPDADVYGLTEGAVYADHSLIAGESFNLLIANVDYRPERYSYSVAAVRDLFSDSVYGTSFKKDGSYREIELLSAVLIRVDRERNELTFTPIPATVQVNDGEGGVASLSRIYSLYGEAALCERVHLLTGIAVDRCAVIIPSAAEKLVDELGGIDMFLGSAAQASGEADAPKGNVKLSGEQVRTVLISEYSGGETREAVASRFMQALIAELGRLEKSELAGMLDIVDTDMTLTELSFMSGRYHGFKKKDIALIGRYEGSEFIPDIGAILDKFSVYRKYYG